MPILEHNKRPLTVVGGQQSLTGTSSHLDHEEQAPWLQHHFLFQSQTGTAGLLDRIWRAEVYLLCLFQSPTSFFRLLVYIILTNPQFGWLASHPEPRTPQASSSSSRYRIRYLLSFSTHLRQPDLGGNFPW
jgi:hypothetical protein